MNAGKDYRDTTHFKLCIAFIEMIFEMYMTSLKACKGYIVHSKRKSFIYVKYKIYILGLMLLLSIWTQLNLLIICKLLINTSTLF